MWTEISQTVDGYNLAGLTQDYGSRMAYWGWKDITTWPTYGDLIYRDDLRGAQPDFDESIRRDCRQERSLRRDRLYRPRPSAFPQTEAEGLSRFLPKVTVT